MHERLPMENTVDADANIEAIIETCSMLPMERHIYADADADAWCEWAFCLTTVLAPC